MTGARHIKVPKMHNDIYEQARKEQQRLKKQGLNKSLFDIMNELLQKKPPRFSI